MGGTIESFEQKQGEQQTLVLTRRLGESLIIKENVIITIEKIGNNEIKIGIEAPRDVVVAREEVVKEVE